MKDIIIKIVIGVSLVVAIISIVIIISLFKSNNNAIQKEEQITIETEKYELDKKTVDYKFKTIEDYEEYLKDVSKKINPPKLQNCVSIRDAYNHLIYGMEGSKDGNWVLIEMTKDAYQELLCRVIKHNEDWSELPLTEHFREKFKPESGVILEDDYVYYDNLYTYVGQFKYNDRLFSVSANSDEYVDYRKWYKFVLDEEGYLDDVIFDHNERVVVLPD